MKLSFKKWLKESIKNYNDSQKPEAIKKRIKKEKLLMELEDVRSVRQKKKNKNWNIQIGNKED